MLRGCDVASWQGKPAEWAAEAGDIDWAAVKISEVMPDGSRDVNPDAEADWRWLEDHGKGRIAYLFGHPGSSPADTIEVFRGQMARLGLDDHDGLAVDLEVTDGRNPAQVCVWARQVLRGLESAYTRKPLCYTFKSFGDNGNTSGLDAWPLWLSAPSDPEGHPAVPAPWKKWAIQQTGISGKLDRDVADYASLEEMARALGRPGAKPPRPPPPAPPKAGIRRWATWGRWSLDREAREHRTTPAEMLACAEAMGHKYGPAMRDYLGRHDYAERLPAGTILYAPRREG